MAKKGRQMGLGVAHENRSLADLTKSIKSFLTNSEVLPLVILLLLCFFFTLLQPAFLTYYNLLTILTQMATLLILTVGMTMVILMAEIDLSVGSVAALAGAITAGLLHSAPDGSPQGL